MLGFLACESRERKFLPFRAFHSVPSKAMLHSHVVRELVATNVVSINASTPRTASLGSLGSLEVLEGQGPKLPPDGDKALAISGHTAPKKRPSKAPFPIFPQPEPNTQQHQHSKYGFVRYFITQLMS
jgi:hypothetical protein